MWDSSAGCFLVKKREEAAGTGPPPQLFRGHRAGRGQWESLLHVVSQPPSGAVQIHLPQILFHVQLSPGLWRDSSPVSP